MRHYHHSEYLTNCTNCQGRTSKAYANAHEGRCKECVTGESTEKLFVCPDCHERRLTLYQKRHHYHCDACTRQAESPY